MANSIITTFLNSAYFLPTVILITAAGSILLFKEFVNPKDDDVEEIALEEVVKGQVEDIVKLFGSEIKKPISYGMTPLGMVNKAWGFNLQAEGVEDYDDEEVDIDNAYYYFQIRPRSWISRFVAAVTDGILNFEIHTKYVVVQKEHVYDGEVITIDDRWIPEKMAGVWLPAFDSGADFVQEKTYKKMFEDTLETSKEAIRHTNKLNLKFVQDIQELEKQEELLQKRFGGKGAGIVNED